MDEREKAGRRNFISLVEVNRDDSDEVNGGWVTFDSIVEEAFDEFSFSDSWLDEFLESEDVFLTLRAPFNQVIKRHQQIGNIDSGWIRIMVDVQRNAERVPAEVVMFGDNLEVLPIVSLSILEVLPQSRTRTIDNLTMLKNEPRAQAGFISGVLDIPLRRTNPKALAIAVYDVGQGNCNAIVDTNEHPRIYFDFGWAPNFHAKSRPHRQPKFFSCESHVTAPVVLSHWDMDHWCYAIKNSSFNPGSLTTKHEWRGDALRRFWIARAPLENEHKLGPLTMAFYRALVETQLLPGLSAILLWPESAKRIPFSAGWLEACRPNVGIPNDRNNNGIAMFVRPNSKSPAILLTGDADFPSIPSLSRQRKPPLAGLVAPHHGARISGLHVPKPKKGSPARVVMSVGDQNTYGHPKQEAIYAYDSNGWVSSRTQDRVDCGCAHPAHRHGNTLLKFGDGPDPECRCNCVPDGGLCLVPSITPLTKPVPGLQKSNKKKATVPI